MTILLVINTQLLPSPAFLSSLSSGPGWAGDMNVCGQALHWFISQAAAAAQACREPPPEITKTTIGSFYWLRFSHYPRVNDNICFLCSERIMLLWGQNLYESPRAWEIGLNQPKSRRWQVEYWCWGQQNSSQVPILPLPAKWPDGHTFLGLCVLTYKMGLDAIHTSPGYCEDQITNITHVSGSQPWL